MAEGDPIVTTDSVKKTEDLSKALAQLDEKTRKVQASLKELVRTQQSSSVEYKNAQTELKGLVAQKQKLTAENGFLATKYAEAKNAMSRFAQENKETTGAVSTLSQSVGTFGDQLLGTTAAVIALGSNLTRTLINPLKGTKEIVDALPAPMKAYNDVMRGHREILDIVNTSYAGFGRGMAQSRVAGRDLVQEIGFLSAKFGFSRDAVKNFVQNSKSLPPIMDAIGKGATGAGVGATQLGDVLLALRGAGMDVTKSGQLMTDLYAKFGTRTAPEAARQILVFSQAAKTTGINIEFVQKHLVAASTPLAIFGQKSDVAARTWTTFTDALKNTVPIEEIGKLVTTVTGKIANMQFQTQAFVAQMSGMSQGVSALGGALRMEMELRTPGGLERNLQRVTRMVARFGGGRINTLQEAVQDPSKEMQFQLQRQLVGQTLGVQGGQEQARVLEVLQKVQRGGISNIEAQKTMAKLTQGGRDVQKASLTALERLATTATQSHEILNTMAGVESKMSGHIEAMANVLTRGRGKEPARPRELRTAGQLLQRGIRDVGREAREAAGRLGRRVRRQGAEVGAGLAGKLPPGVTTAKPARVMPTGPVERIMAERRGERVMPGQQNNLPGIEDIINQPLGRPQEMPTGAMPFDSIRRRQEAPAGMTVPGAPAGTTGGAGSDTRAPAPGGEVTADAAAAGQSTNVTISVMCEDCHKEIVRKELAELNETRDKHLQGVAT